MSQTPTYNQRNLASNVDRVELPQQPRPPMKETEARLLHSGDRSVQQMGSNFPKIPSLNVGAPEFVPRTHQNSMQLQHSILTPPLAQSDIVSNFSQMHLGQGGGGGGGGGGGDADAEEVLLMEFSNTLLTLTTSPGNYIEYLKPLLDKLRLCMSPEVFTHIINLLYEQCVYEPNFRYTGARVLNFLCSELRSHPIFGTFKARFLKRCQEDYNSRDDLIRNGGVDGLQTVCGLALFMGELFLNVTIAVGGKTEPLEFLPGALTDLLLTLVDFPSDGRIKTACQLLKLAGGHTEDALKDEASRINFNMVFKHLESVKDSTLLSKNIQLLVQSVLAQRKNNWGRLEIPQAASNVYHPDTATRVPDFSQSEPVFYKGGKPVTREEAGFVEEEEEEENYEVCELTEEEEQDFLRWQEESQYENPLISGPPPQPPTIPLVTQHGYGDAPVYPAWSTNDSNAYGSYITPAYDQNYEFGFSNSNYPVYPDDGLQMDDEAEQAYEEFLSSQRR